MHQARPFQTKLKMGIYASWNAGHKAVIGVAPTGAGKTFIMADMATELNAPTCIIAHRGELVQQISMALARAGLRHRIIAAEKTIKVIISQHIAEFGVSFYDPKSLLCVAGVNTLIARKKTLIQWANTIRYWMIDECHHVLFNNQWGTATQMFTNAFGVGFTASPIRCDRKSLHKAQGGVFTDMIVGPSPRELMDMGFLCDYKIYGPPQSINRDDLVVGATREYTGASVKKAVEKSTITGDIPKHYLMVCAATAYGCTLADLKLVDGILYYPNGTSCPITQLQQVQLRGITFTIDIESATKTAQAYRDMGVSAEAVSAKTPDAVRNAVLDKFKRGELMQLVNVDLFGEGFDVPGVVVVSMGRPTQSFGLFAQQFGRMLRILTGKAFGILIDHVGNVKQHGLPDIAWNWTLEAENSGRRSTAVDPDIMPVSICVRCFRDFEAITSTCPHCKHVQEPESRSEPKFVDGDLVEFSEELLAQLRAKIKDVDREKVYAPNHLKNTPMEGRLNRLHGEKQVAQSSLRESISLWAGIRRDKGMGDSEIYRRFFHSYKTDILSAQSLDASDAEALNIKITEGYWK